MLHSLLVFWWKLIKIYQFFFNFACIKIIFKSVIIEKKERKKCIHFIMLRFLKLKKDFNAFFLLQGLLRKFKVFLHISTVKMHFIYKRIVSFYFPVCDIILIYSLAWLSFQDVTLIQLYFFNSTTSTVNHVHLLN